MAAPFADAAIDQIAAIEARGYHLLHEERKVEGSLDLLREARIDGEVGFAVDVERMMDDRDDRHPGCAKSE